MGGAALEGLVDDPEDAVALFESGTVGLARAVPPPRAPSARWPAWSPRRCGCSCSRTPPPGARTYCSLNEGLGKVLRYGAYAPEVLDPAALDARRARPAAAGRRPRHRARPVDVTGILTQMLQMGDEAHNRNRAGTLMLLRDLAPGDGRPAAPTPPTSPRRCASSAATTTSSSTSRCRPASSRSTPPAASTGSTMVVAMARNGTDFGIQVAGTGDEWFTGPAQVADGLFLGDYGPDDANPDIGDSAITETAGIGGFAMATAPGDRAASSAARCPTRWPPPAGCTRSRSARTRAGRCRCWSSRAPRPASTSPGSAAPASCRRSTPAWPASVAGVGQVGAGLVTPPAEIFPKALARLAELASPGRGRADTLSTATHRT